jgi:hypothetical protein
MENYFYKITNLINGKFYYGSGSKEKYEGSGSALSFARKKYGKENFKFEILKRFNTREEAYTFEDKFLKIFKISNNPMSYNKKDSALGGNTYANKSNEEMSLIKEKLSTSGKKRIFTEEHRKNLSERAKSRKGNKPCKFKGMKYEDYLPQEKIQSTKDKIAEGAKRPMKQETKDKIKSTWEQKKLNDA